MVDYLLDSYYNTFVCNLLILSISALEENRKHNDDRIRDTSEYCVCNSFFWHFFAGRLPYRAVESEVPSSDSDSDSWQCRLSDSDSNSDSDSGPTPTFSCISYL